MKGHRVEIEFADGFMSAKLLCPDGCGSGTGNCDLRDWFDNVAAEEILQGKVIVSVRDEWPGEEERPVVHLDQQEEER